MIRSHLRAARRRGFTLVEILLVMVLLLMLAAVVLPSITAFRGDSRPRAAADTIRGELAVARSRAMEEGRPYRVTVSESGDRIRRAPDGADFAQAPAAPGAGPSAAVVEYALEHVTAEVTSEAGEPAETIDGWVTVALVLPDGSCRDETALVVVTEPDRSTLRVRVRGLTASSRVVPNGGEK